MVKLVATLSSYGRRAVVVLAAWPIDMPANWLERVNQTDNAQELEAFVGVCNEAAPLASRNGRRKSRNVWA